MIYVDEPRWPAHGRLWSHLVSDVSFDELHAFAEALGAPRRGFDRDHYDVPAERYRTALWLGARPVRSREIVDMLVRAGLRRPKHRYRSGGSASPASAERTGGSASPASPERTGGSASPASAERTGAA